MRSLIGVTLLAAINLWPISVRAQEVEALRKELEQMRKQFEEMKQGYEKSINQLSERIKGLESRSEPPAVAAPAPSAPAPSTSPTGAGAPSVTQAPSEGQPSLLELARPREPFALYGKRGPGQLLFDIGLTGDFIGNLTQDNVQKATGGTFADRENRFFPREVELNLFGQIDPYARAEVRIEAGEESRGEETTVRLAEATISLMTLPFGTQAKLGQMRNRFGLTNEIHEHDLPFIDRPNVLVRFFGEDGLVEKGAEFTWVPPVPFFLEVLGGIFNGDNDTAFGRGSIKYPLVTGRVRTFFDFEEFGAIQLGMSVASGQTPERLQNTILGWDAKYKYKPEGWQHPLLTLAGEALYQMRRANVSGEDVDGDGVPDTPNEKRTLERVGWWGYAELQPFRFGPFSLWSAGFRYDWTEYPVNPGHEWAVQPYLSFMPTEFLRFRLGYKHTERSSRDGINLNGGSARSVDELLLQATFILGAHPAHPF
ncbi:MAG: hypothetical protein C5B48_12960 [Candidatus Rokuibacteriota bacterium]|nr:MAG: hypothetical protein C5B48_12960 [Candidatus Rokubacteria bacterium]